MTMSNLKKVWKCRQGNTALIDGYADQIIREIADEFHLQSIPSGGWLFAHKVKDYVNLYAFGQYESFVLPESLHARFVMMVPAGTELVRPEKEKKPRDFNINPMKD
jgi:hypothetical protein